MKVFVSHESHPIEDCAAATVVVAAASRMEAVAALRSAGFAARDVELTSSGSAEERVALQEPGVVLWTDWAADVGVREWRRM